MDEVTQSEREIRAARNQSMMREINERLEGLAKAFQFVAERASFTCECVDLTCTEQMQLTIAEYELVRVHPTHFVVLPGHVREEVEDVVGSHDGYVVVAKLNEGARLAKEADPRADGA